MNTPYNMSVPSFEYCCTKQYAEYVNKPCKNVPALTPLFVLNSNFKNIH